MSAAASASASGTSVVLVDQDNVRAAMGWPTGSAFRAAVAGWSPNRLVVLAIDDRKRSERQTAWRIAGDYLIAVGSGPRWRADDSIARDAEWWLARDAEVLVVSSDKLVRRRCREVLQRLGTPAGRLRFESADAFRLQLPRAPEAAVDGGAHAPAPWSADVSAFLAWVSSEQPGPSRTASELVHAAERQRRGKRKLGVYK